MEGLDGNGQIGQGRRRAAINIVLIAHYVVDNGMSGINVQDVSTHDAQTMVNVLKRSEKCLQASNEAYAVPGTQVCLQLDGFLESGNFNLTNSRQSMPMTKGTGNILLRRGFILAEGL